MTATFVAALVGAGAILLAMVLALATGVNRIKQISGWILAPTGLIGLVFYTLAYVSGAQAPGEVPGAVVHGVYTTCLMFMGRNDFSSMTRLAPWFSASAWMQFVFWLAHLGALFVSASAVLSTIGKKMLQTLRLRLVRKKNLYLVFGLHSQSLFLGRDLARREKGQVVYVSPRPEPELVEQALAFGGIVRTAPYLQNGSLSGHLMRLLGLRRGTARKVCLLALDPSETINIDITRAGLAYCQAAGIATGGVQFYLRGQGELDYSQLAQFEDASGNIYDVDAFSDAELSARLLVHESPPYKSISFTPDGLAKEDFHALIIGFGQVGQHTLRQVVMNSQFEGSDFTAVVVDQDAEKISGQFARRYVGMLKEYDIRFRNMDIRSHEFYDMLDKLAPSLKYIVVCLGDDDANYEATADLERYFARMAEDERPFILVSVCNKRYVATTQKNIRFFDRQQQVFSSDVILRENLDKMALAVNWSYCEGSGKYKSARDAWRHTNYFSRESSRASADFIPAMLHIAGFEEGAVPTAQQFATQVPNPGILLENLTKTEHLRWNSFHYAMGFTCMDKAEVLARAATGTQQVAKDLVHYKHACLVTWDALVPLAQLVGDATGTPPPDYQEMDRQNVYNIPRTLALYEDIAAD